MQQMNRDAARKVVVETIREVREDWELSMPIDDSTGLFNDIGFESIDAVALGSAIEEHFDRSLPFAEFLTRANEENWSDVTVGQLVDFITQHLDGSPTAAPQ
ncbi:MAG: hypothetical protein GC160_05035 [Acidobacteria bacterium]|nr:hypothetical protein [Acidobacteriota bacterium]